MSSRKSQIFGQVFVYLLAIIIFSLILLYGYKMIQRFSKDAEDISVIQLTTDIKTAAKKISSDYGSVIKKEVRIPSKYIYVCFVDLDYSGQAPATDICTGGSDYHPAVCNSWVDNAKQNMYLITEKEEIDPYFIEGIKTKDEYVCININEGKIILRFEGKGDYAELSEWT